MVGLRSLSIEMIFRISAFVTLIFILSTASAQDKKLKDFKSFNGIESETLFWSKGYTRPKIETIDGESHIYFVDRFEGKKLDYKMVAIDLAKLELVPNLPEFPACLDVSNLERYHSNVSFIKNDRFSVIVGYGVIYLFKKNEINEEHKAPYILSVKYLKETQCV